jgi:predicted nucleic acid-binding protein
MFLVDTAIWIDHIRRPDNDLVRLLNSELVLIHPFIVGEIALGRIKNLGMFLARLGKLPKAIVAHPTEVLEFIRNGDLAGSGIGYVDAHLAASTVLTPEARLWTRDKRLRAVAGRLSIAAALD